MDDGFRPQALLLDFYGTVVEEDDIPIGQICRRIAEASPTGAVPAEIGSYWGRVFREMCTGSYGSAFRPQKELERLSLMRVLQQFRCDLDPGAPSRALYRYWRRPTIFPESKEVLAQLRLPVCLVSNIDNAELQSALSHHGLRFDLAVTSEECRAYKPRAQVFQKALALLGLARDEVLHVGDSLAADVRGARALGIRVLWVNRRNRPLPADADAPDYVSADLTELLRIT